MIRFSCKWCGKRYKADDRHAGRSHYCKKCKKPIWAPAPYLYFSCKTCGKQFRTQPRYQGLTLPCRECGEPVTAPWDSDRKPIALDAVQLAKDVKEHGPDFSPFELSVDPERQPLAGNLAIVPLDQVAAGGLPPAAELVFDDDDDLPEAELASQQIALAQTAEGSLSSLPMAELNLLKNIPLARSAPPPSPPPAPAASEHSTDHGLSSTDKSVQKKLACPRCGGMARQVVEARTQAGIAAMIVFAVCGLLTAFMIDEHWLYILATLALFGLSVAASFHKRRSMRCQSCGQQLI